MNQQDASASASAAAADWHRSAADLDRLWREGPPPPRERGTVRLICVRRGDERHDTPDRAELTLDRGLAGDRWAAGDRPEPAAQVTLMNARVAELVAAGRAPLHTPGDNFLVDLDLSLDALPPGSRLRLGTALLEVSELPHTGCKKFRARFGLGALTWVDDPAHPGRRLRGINCRVLEPGTVSLGDVVAIEPAAGDASQVD